LATAHRRGIGRKAGKSVHQMTRERELRGAGQRGAYLGGRNYCGHRRKGRNKGKEKTKQQATIGFKGGGTCVMTEGGAGPG